jgi:hypothetical protein
MSSIESICTVPVYWEGKQLSTEAVVGTCTTRSGGFGSEDRGMRSRPAVVSITAVEQRARE